MVLWNHMIDYCFFKQLLELPMEFQTLVSEYFS
jgi:hypothetical protein